MKGKKKRKGKKNKARRCLFRFFRSPVSWMIENGGGKGKECCEGGKKEEKKISGDHIFLLLHTIRASGGGERKGEWRMLANAYVQVPRQ